MILYWAFRLASALVQAAPLPLAYAVGRIGGLIAFAAWRGGRRRSIANMRHVVDDEASARALARRSFAHYGAYLVDFLRSTSITAEQARAHLHFDGWGQLDTEREAGRGAVFVTLHYGNWDLGGAAIAAHGVPITVVGDTFADARLDELVLGARRHLGMEIVAAGRMAPSLLRALRQRHVVALLIDVPPPPGSGIEVTFFGEPVLVADGAARLALRAGAAVFAVTLHRRHPMREDVDVRWEQVRWEQVRGMDGHWEPTGDADHDARTLTQAVMSALERQVRQAPEQWYLFRAFWHADREARR